MYCSNCGKEVVKNSKFCKHCGYPLQKGDLNNNNIEINESTNSNEDELIIDSENINYVDIVKVAKSEGKLRAEIINLLVENGLTDNEAEKLIQKIDIDKNLESITIEELKEDSTDKDIYSDKMESDSLDKWFGIKGTFNKSELSERRFQISFIILYLFSIWNILLGLYFTYGTSSELSPSISSSGLLWGGVFYFIFTFSFHMLRMPIMLGLLLLGMLADKLYTMFLVQKVSGMVIFISIIIFIGVIQSFRSKSNLESKSNKTIKFIISSVFAILVSLGITISINPYIFEDTEWDEQKNAHLKDIIFKSYNFYDEKDKLKDFNDGETFFISLAEKTAQCSVIKTTEEFPNYAKFLNDLDSENDNSTKQRFKEIKQNCFGKNYKELQKEKNKWTTSAYFNIANGIKSKYIELYKENYGPLNSELTKKYEDMSFNIGKCVAESLKNKFPKYKEFEINYLSNEKTNDVKKAAQNIEAECRNKYSEYIPPKEWNKKIKEEFRSAIESGVLKSLNKGGKLSQKESKTLSYNTSLCFIEKLQSEYSNYANFDKEFYINKNKEITQKISEIRNDCLNQSTKEYLKEKESIWTKYYINDLTNLFSEQYYTYINTAKNSNSLTEKEKRNISNNTAKCIVNKITTTYPHFTDFMKAFSKKESKVIKDVEKFKNDCFVKNMLGI